VRNSTSKSPSPIGLLASIDETDRAIIDLLQQDGRLSNRAIAQRVGISEGTVRNRIRKLKDLGLVRVTALLNLFEDPQAVSAYVLVKLSTRDLIGAAEAFSRLPGVASVSAVAGQYDLIAEVLAGSKTGLIEFVTRRLAAVAEVRAAETMIILKSFNKWAAGLVEGLAEPGPGRDLEPPSD